MQLKSNTPINKIDCYVHFAVKSGKVIWGIDNLVKSKKRIFIILYDGALGQNSMKDLKKVIDDKNIPSLQLPENYLNTLLKRENVKVLSVLDESLARAILGYCE